MRTIKCGYHVECDWPESCVLQGNETGIVISTKNNSRRKTAFFEAFPKKPNDCFIRGEGNTLQEAEMAAFDKFKTYVACPEHVYERLSDKGRGKCASCSMIKLNALPSIFKCMSCDCTGVENEIYDGPGLDADIKGHMCNSCYFNIHLKTETKKIINSATSRRELEEELSFHTLSLIQAYFYCEYMKDDEYSSFTEQEQISRLEKIFLLHYSLQAELKEMVITYLLLQKDKGYCECLDDAAIEEVFTLNNAKFLKEYSCYLFTLKRRLDQGEEYNMVIEFLRPKWKKLVSDFISYIDVINAEYQLLKNNNSDFEKRVRINTREETSGSFKAILTALSNYKSK